MVGKNRIEATVETSSGTKIRISGIKDEVKEVLSIFTDKVKRRTSLNKRHGKNITESKTSKRKQPVKGVLTELVQSGFFKGKEKHIEDIVDKLSQRGHNIKGRKIGAVASALAFLCRDESCNLERRRLGKDEKTDKENWVYYSKEK
jgi:hypothetical protein